MRVAPMEVITLKPGYVALIQKPMCCAVACLQMILYRNGFGLRDQEELAIRFGVKIQPEYAVAFRSEMPIMTRPNFDEGIQTVESENEINAFLNDNAAPLVARCIKYSAIPSVANYISTHLRANRDIGVEYHAQEIHGDDEFKGNYVHDGLIESFDFADGTLTIMDSVPNHRQRLHITLPVLEKSMSSRYGRETGFVVIERNG
jgi:hypothetical protein